jgi:arsenite methyltransferase
MKTAELDNDQVRSHVRQRYESIARNGSACGCAPKGCGEATGSGRFSKVVGYSDQELAAVPEGANLGLGCGNPVALASLKPGQTVLDLGCGAGLDAFLATRAVGSTGQVIGVDMTPEMITKARQNKTKGDYSNVEFRLGEIEHLPVADSSVDVVLSNCVINLSPDKPQVFREAFRVLRPGGRLAVSDIVTLQPLPEALRGDWERYSSCISGAASVAEVTGYLKAAGFVDVRVEPKAQSRKVLREWFPDQGLEDYIASAVIEASRPSR